jgi:hypothetical protein
MHGRFGLWAFSTNQEWNWITISNQLYFKTMLSGIWIVNTDWGTAECEEKMYAGHVLPVVYFTSLNLLKTISFCQQGLYTQDNHWRQYTLNTLKTMFICQQGTMTILSCQQGLCATQGPIVTKTWKSPLYRANQTSSFTRVSSLYLHLSASPMTPIF